MVRPIPKAEMSNRLIVGPNMRNLEKKLIFFGGHNQLIKAYQITKKNVYDKFF